MEIEEKKKKAFASEMSFAQLKFAEWRYVLKHLCYYRAEHIFFSPHDDVFISLHTYICLFYFLATWLQKEWRQNMFLFFLIIERDALN